MRNPDLRRATFIAVPLSMLTIIALSTKAVR
jgi:hypothetical protein